MLIVCRVSAMRVLLAMGGLVAMASQAAAPSDPVLTRVGPDGTFAAPIAIRAPNDGTGRVFVIERCSGIRLVKNGQVQSTPFLTLSPAPACAGEQGLLGLAFDPNYAVNGTFYVAYTAPGSHLGASQDQVVARFVAAPANADSVPSGAGQIILRVPDIANNHNGGDIHFGQDGYLYWSMGDGGVQGDPNGFAQCTGRKKADNMSATCYTTSGGGPTYYLLGKIIRIDVHATTASAAANMCGATVGQAAQYAIPAGNPFANATSFPNDCAEIFNWGYRNPFRFSFDRQTGDLLIGDVGQNTYEEIDYQAAGSAGQNFQWNACEGLHTYPGGVLGCTGPSASVRPKLDYAHGSRCAVIGGYRYRGPIVALGGQYVFGDFCSGEILLVANPDPLLAAWSFAPLPAANYPSGAGPDFTNGLYGFGEDAAGNMYLADAGSGNVWKFVSDRIFADGFGP